MASGLADLSDHSVALYAPQKPAGIRGVTFSPFMPLIAVALIYLVLGFFFGLWHPGWLVFLAIPLGAIANH